MAWTTPTWIDLRATAAFVTDPSGAGGSVNTANSSDLPTYTAGPNSNSPLTINGNTFNCGWTVPGGDVDGARDRSSSVSDKRLAGLQFSKQTGTAYVLEVQAGTAPGAYNIWLAITDQGSNGYPAATVTIADANGALTTVTMSAQTGLQVCDATGTVSSTAAAWATLNPVAGGGNFITVNSTDTSNGNGGPLLQFSSTADSPFSSIGIQYVPASSANVAWLT